MCQKLLPHGTDDVTFVHHVFFERAGVQVNGLPGERSEVEFGDRVIDRLRHEQHFRRGSRAVSHLCGATPGQEAREKHSRYPARGELNTHDPVEPRGHGAGTIASEWRCATRSEVVVFTSRKRQRRPNVRPSLTLPAREEWRHSLPKTRSTTQHPRTCVALVSRQCERMC